MSETLWAADITGWKLVAIALGILLIYSQGYRHGSR